MTFEEWSERENYALKPEGNTFDTNILRECWEYSRLSALEEAAKHVDEITGPTGGWLDSPAHMKAWLSALVRPVPGREE